MAERRAIEVLDLTDPAPLESKMYVLVRRDLPWPIRCVQGIHAVMALQHQMGLQRGLGMRDFGLAVVLLGVANEAELNQWHQRLPGSAIFNEPDLWSEATAIAYLGFPIKGLDELKLM